MAQTDPGTGLNPTPPEPGVISGVHDPTAPHDGGAPLVPPEIMAQSLPDYLRAQWLRLKGGESGILPVIFALIVITIVFQ